MTAGVITWKRELSRDSRGVRLPQPRCAKESCGREERRCSTSVGRFGYTSLVGSVGFEQSGQLDDLVAAVRQGSSQVVLSLNAR